MIVTLEAKNGKPVPIELSTLEEGLIEAGLKERLESVGGAVRDGFSSLHSAIEAIAEEFHGTVDKLGPDKMSITVGFKFSGKLGFVVASTESGAEISVSFEWNTNAKR